MSVSEQEAPNGLLTSRLGRGTTGSAIVELGLQVTHAPTGRRTRDEENKPRDVPRTGEIEPHGEHEATERLACEACQSKGAVDLMQKATSRYRET